MTAQLRIDASDFARVAQIFDRLPHDMQAIAFRRAAARTRSVVERNYARFASQHIEVPQKHIKARMRSRLDGGTVELTVKSKNIPLHELRASQRAYGVFVPGRGRYDDAFIPAVSSRRAAGLVLQRQGSARLPTQMMFGPNPANAVARTPSVYLDVLAKIAKGEFAKVVMQQVAYLLASKG